MSTRETEPFFPEGETSNSNHSSESQHSQSSPLGNDRDKYSTKEIDRDLSSISCGSQKPDLTDRIQFGTSCHRPLNLTEAQHIRSTSISNSFAFHHFPDEKSSRLSHIYSDSTHSHASNPMGNPYGKYIESDKGHSSLPYSQVVDVPLWARSRAEGWDDEDDDEFHDPKKRLRSQTGWSSSRVWQDLFALCLLIAAITMLFLIWPVLQAYGILSSSIDLTSAVTVDQTDGATPGGFALIDPDTPENVYTKTSPNTGEEFQLVFSDEFNTEGRSFYPGDDPYWEAVDLWYWATENYEWYSPDAITTVNGSLAITLSQTPTHGKNFRGGMMSSWNKFCFTGGYIEASVQLPGRADVAGLWPAFWMMGNLGRAGYGGSVDGLWPYSYETCDVGTLQNQTDWKGYPQAAATAGDTIFNRQYNTKALSWAVGQRLSSCSCPEDASLHPGPQLANGSLVGRSAPEIDVFEAQSDGTVMQLSQSLQMAPFNAFYEPSNTTGPAYIFHSETAEKNSYAGAVLQQALSFISDIPDQNATQFDGGDFGVYGVDYTPGMNGSLTWVNGGTPSVTLTSAALEPDPVSAIARRPVSNEPMYIIFNLGISQSFGTPSWDELEWPNIMLVDWVRVYQPKNAVNIGCDPEDYPTYNFIQNNMDAYTNPDFKTWGEGGYGGDWPRNRIAPEGCSATLKDTVPTKSKAPYYASSSICVGCSW